MLFQSKNKRNEKKEDDSKTSRFSLPTLQITSEREDEIIEQLAEKIKQYGLEVPALLLLVPLQPLSPIASYLGLLPLAPFLEAFDISGFDYVSFFSKPENVSKLLKKIEETKLKKKEKK
jgi:hypothetical protein